MSNQRKLSESDVRAIRSSNESVRTIADRLHVSHNLIWQVRNVRTYKDVQVQERSSESR